MGWTLKDAADACGNNSTVGRVARAQRGRLHVEDLYDHEFLD
jgi:hypothetical protein